MKVVFIDGPREGRVEELPDYCTSYVVPVPRDLSATEWMADASSLMLRQEVYTLHHVKLFGWHLVVGSCNPQGPQEADAFRVLMSDTAKQAVN